VNQGIIRRRGGYLLALPGLMLPGWMLPGWMDEKGYSQIEDNIRESSLYVFSIVAQAFPTHVR